MGLSLAAAGLLRDPFVAIGLFSFVGLFNMPSMIPTITLSSSGHRRCSWAASLSSRQALVFGAIALSMGLSGWMAEQLGANVVLVIAGGICAAAGGVGLLIPPSKRPMSATFARRGTDPRPTGRRAGRSGDRSLAILALEPLPSASSRRHARA